MTAVTWPHLSRFCLFRVLHRQWGGLPGIPEPDQLARRQTLPLLERDLPAPLQHPQISQRRGWVGKSQLLQVSPVPWPQIRPRCYPQEGKQAQCFLSFHFRWYAVCSWRVITAGYGIPEYTGNQGFGVHQGTFTVTQKPLNIYKKLFCLIKSKFSVMSAPPSKLLQTPKSWRKMH